MRDYSKVSPSFWTGDTGKELRRRGTEALVVGLYLMTSPTSNMLGLYYQPVLYMAHETGLGIEGVRKGLHHCIEAGFCQYDPSSEMVWVVEMAAYQIAEELKATDLRCKGIQKDYDSLPNNQFLSHFFDRYQGAFHLTRRRHSESQAGLFEEGAYEAPSKPGTGTGTGTGTGERISTLRVSSLGSDPAAAKSTPKRKLPACPYAEIVAAYHEALPSLPKVKLQTKRRQDATAKFWKFVLTSEKSDGSPRATDSPSAIEWIAGFFRRASENDFLMGRSPRAEGHANWVCDFDFLLTDKGLKQVIEKTRGAT